MAWNGRNECSAKKNGCDDQGHLAPAAAMKPLPPIESTGFTPLRRSWKRSTGRRCTEQDGRARWRDKARVVFDAQGIKKHQDECWMRASTISNACCCTMRTQSIDFFCDTCAVQIACSIDPHLARRTRAQAYRMTVIRFATRKSDGAPSGDEEHLKLGAALAARGIASIEETRLRSWTDPPGTVSHEPMQRDAGRCDIGRFSC